MKARLGIFAIAAAVILVLFFQNCAGYRASTFNEGVSNSASTASCENSSVVGIWHESPNNPSAEILQFNPDCTGESKACSSKFIYQPVVGLQGQTEIQILETQGDPQQCLPPGRVQCSYTIIDSGTGRDLEYNCNGITIILSDSQSSLNSGGSTSNSLPTSPPNGISIGQGANGKTYYRTPPAVNTGCVDLYKEAERIIRCQSDYAFRFNRNMIFSRSGASGYFTTLNGRVIYSGFHDYSCGTPVDCTVTCTFQTGAQVTSPTTINFCD